ncbi:NAD(P)/FAD-dependent oxidoreductase [Armatimonas sp.]|uniref:NAD(P)/FAD-dependent oxidoreductase n=1 Tax=Armatimonas sp. TaxID=1872638 RepID=UPI00286BB4EA|nr:NAD(P)/FAD-dependent oxidoreductase [Armatimonas sp.]
MSTKPRVVIVGGGFGGCAAAKGLKDAPVEVLMLDKTNHYVFQPLLYQVATAALAPTEITYPIRTILRKQKNATVWLAEVTGVDVNAKTLSTTEGKTIPYDYLILACGARHSYFGRDDWEPLAPGLKTLGDALEMRQRFLMAFEEAEKCDDPALQQAWLTFVIVGGGPTGCELAGVLPEIAKKALSPDFRRVDLHKTRILLIENSPCILNTFPEDLAQQAQKDLKRLGVEVRNGVKVTDIRPEGVTLSSGEEIAARTVFWAAGNKAAPVGGSLGVPTDRAGRVIVERDLSIPGHPEVFVIGDMAQAALRDSSGELIPEKLVPGVAQGAVQGGACAARNVIRRVNHHPTEPFKYQNLGDLAVLGRGAAIGNLPWGKVKGYFAWGVWLFVHVLKLVGYRNRLNVLLEWAYAYLTYQRGARLISNRRR